MSGVRHRSSSSSMHGDLLDLSRRLRQERLFVQNEKVQLQELNERVKAACERLAHEAWVSRRQRQNLDGLVLGAVDSTPAACFQRANLLQQTIFQDAYKHLNYHEIVYSEFLRTLRDKPKLMAYCLTEGDRLGLPYMAEVASIAFSGIYGGCIMREDEELVLKLLHNLMRLQLTSAQNPRKLLRQGNCSFSRLYKAFNEELFSAKLFLTSALYEPILALLTDVQVFLDVDPDKTIIRFRPQERTTKFGKEGTPEYENAVKEYRQFVVSELEKLTNRFIREIRANLHCFPPSLARLLRAIYSLLMSSGRAEPKEVSAVCVDIIFDLFICPAMVDPNPVGIIDTPISYVARSNLMQVARILQVLALWKWEEIDPKHMDLYSRFDKEVMSSVLEAMVKAGEVAGVDEDTTEGETDDASAGGAAGSSAQRNPDIAGNSGGGSLSRLAVLVTKEELTTLISFLRTVMGNSEDPENADIVELSALLTPLPENVPDSNSSSSTSKMAGDISGASQKKKQGLANKLSTVATKVSDAGRNAVTGVPKRPHGDGSGLNHEEEGDGNAEAGSEGSSGALIPREPDSVMIIPLLSAGGDPPGFLSEEHVLARTRQASRVVRMNLANLPGGGGGGSDAGDSFISGGAGEKRTRFSLSHDEGSIGNTSDNLEAISEAASNHSVDSSLEDEVDQAEDPIIDNLSDMVSANVSGRGTPNVSGRDTPSSQVTEGEELIGRGIAGGNENVAADNVDEGNNVHVAAEAAADANDANEPVEGPAEAGVAAEAPAEQEGAARQAGNGGRGGAIGRNRAAVQRRGPKSGEPDLEEKFGRFEIKPPPGRRFGPSSSGGTTNPLLSEQGDETVSMVSDTWSTDVLASDTETLPGEAESVGGRSVGLEDIVRGGNRMLDELVVPPTGGGGSLSSVPSANLLDVSETASEAWSMDVLASDSESLRLGELDNEDTASVARSDDTRFTDDTTRSDPDPLLDVSGASGGNIQGPHNKVRRDDLTRKNPTASEGQLRPSRAAATEQWARQSRGGGSAGGNLPRRGSDSSGLGNDTGKGFRRSNEASILKKPTNSPLSSAAAASSSRQSTATTVITNAPNADDVSQLSSHLSAASIASSESSGESDGKNKNVKATAATSSSFTAAVGTAGASNSVSQPQSLLDTDNPPSAVPPAPRSAPPASSTGAIPKSISFDKAVIDSSMDSDRHGKNRGERGFFRSFKLPKIGKGASGSTGGRVGPGSSGSNSRSASIKSDDYLKSSEKISNDVSDGGADGHNLRRSASDETSDDILAKYRKKVVTNQADSNVDSTDGAAELRQSGSVEEIDERLVMDPRNVEASYAFQDAKRKLRLMLSEADLSMLGNLVSTTEVKKTKEENELVWFLRVQLAEANNLQDRGMVAQLHETLRCLSLFDSDGLRKLVRALKEDYRRRTPYLAYLMRCRQGLLNNLSQQQRLISRMEVDRKVCSQYLVSVCVRLFLERRSQHMQQFAAQFRQTSASDEKTLCLERFLAQLWAQLEEDPSWALSASEEQMSMARLAIERAVASEVYMFAMYPNGEADASRDQVLQGHLSRLSESVTPAHRDLRVPRQYHYEAPWPSAQAEIRRLPAYKTARDKVDCVVRCCQTIMNLLSLASGNSVPAADDFVPVLVFVLIKANPPGLLSTVQYVDSFYGSRLSGEEQYWWMQFAAAIEFIKTMD